ncbi:unnamed protein product, partial [Tetraodon nigroviridis]
MDTDLIHAPAVGLTEEEEADMNDWKLPLAFMKKRHSEKIEGSKALAQSWRMKDRSDSVLGGGLSESGMESGAFDHSIESFLLTVAKSPSVQARSAGPPPLLPSRGPAGPPAAHLCTPAFNTPAKGSWAPSVRTRTSLRMKTVSVALVLCLNVGVDPPDVVKTSPCARLECWIDPLSMSPQKALETIGANLQKQYENWQPRVKLERKKESNTAHMLLRRNMAETRGAEELLIYLHVFMRVVEEAAGVSDVGSAAGDDDVIRASCGFQVTELRPGLLLAPDGGLLMKEPASPPLPAQPCVRVDGQQSCRWRAGALVGNTEACCGLKALITEARYKQSLDPTVDEVKKLCTSLRRNAKEERVLFHYNGHGVPRPTVNGEIWVFNKVAQTGGAPDGAIRGPVAHLLFSVFQNYTQYIPLSIYDLQTWMGSPSIFVYDCSNAGIIVKSFKQFALQREQELETSAVLCVQVAAINPSHPLAQMPLPPSMKNCIQLAACEANELLPMNPDLPADLFTSCLTTPIKIALRWFCMQKSAKLVPGVTLDLIEKIPGRLNDRRTRLGELNWIFTAITDTICLERAAERLRPVWVQPSCLTDCSFRLSAADLFQKLFRQDLLVASLFRNFLLAERIMRSYNCTPVSSPRLPPTYMHAMWQAWDLAVDICLSQLPTIIEEGTAFRHSPFFAEQLTAFQVWLTMGVENRNPPEQLPIVLQGHTHTHTHTHTEPPPLSQVHRLRALDLLGRFLDLGPWAVSLALSVGIFPYVLKLLQSSARELRPLLVFIWAKILAVDSSCQADLVKDNGHKYFLSVLADSYMPAEHRTMAVFILAVIVNSYSTGQEACLQGNLIANCLEQLSDPHPLLRQWVAICLGRIWQNFDPARWCGVRDSAHEKLYTLLSDPVPEVRP